MAAGEPTFLLWALLDASKRGQGIASLEGEKEEKERKRALASAT